MVAKRNSMPQPDVAHRWSPIADLPAGHAELAHSDLEALRGVWLEQKSALEADDAVKDFNKRLVRRLAIETGLIERLYTLDRGITELLVERGLDASFVPRGTTDGDPQHVVRMIRDHAAAVEGLFGFVAARRDLGTSYVKELHSALTASQSHVDAIDSLHRKVKVPLRRGDYKQRPNNPRGVDGRIHEYCPPAHVASEMERLIKMHGDHEIKGVAPEVEAAWLHHRFAQIHPFQDGNGRVARALATLVLLKAGGFPLVVTNDQRDIYIDALREADNGRLRPLVNLFARIERKAFVEAIGVAHQTKQGLQNRDSVIAAIRDSMAAQPKVQESNWDRARDISESLRQTAMGELEAVANTLQSEIGPLAPLCRSFEFYADHSDVGDERARWFRHRIIATAKNLGYFANPSSHHIWARLVLKMTTHLEILLSFHGLGREFRGVVIGSACIYEKDTEGDVAIPAHNVRPLTDEPFQVNYKETEQTVSERFRDWFGQALDRGLAIAYEAMRS